MPIAIRLLTDEDYDAVSALWNATEQSRRALNPVDDTREGIARYLRRNPNTCFAAVRDGTLVGVILTGDNVQKRRLTRAIRADKGQAVVLLQAEGDVVEQHTATVCLRDMLGLKNH